MKTKSNNSELQNRPEQRSTSRLARINFAKRELYRSLDTQTFLTLLRSRAPRFFELAEVVGKWVWIQFSEQPATEIRQQLAELGFHWNDARQSWQHPCGVFCDERAPFDPRKKYGSYFAADYVH